jgi:hypothetical protein
MGSAEERDAIVESGGVWVGEGWQAESREKEGGRGYTYGTKEGERKRERN